MLQRIIEKHSSTYWPPKKHSKYSKLAIVKFQSKPVTFLVVTSHGATVVRTRKKSFAYLGSNAKVLLLYIFNSLQQMQLIYHLSAPVRR